MNIAFFLISKHEVAFLSPSHTVRQALEKMEFHRYTALPLVNKKGKYVGTITEGDLLRVFRQYPNYCFEDTSTLLLKDIPMQRVNTAVSINATMEDMFSLVSVQNFVPVIDDNGIFIGIIRRREVIQYFKNKYDDASQKLHADPIPFGTDK